jgi:hypothetical protein
MALHTIPSLLSPEDVGNACEEPRRAIPPAPRSLAEVAQRIVFGSTPKGWSRQAIPLVPFGRPRRALIPPRRADYVLPVERPAPSREAASCARGARRNGTGPERPLVRSAAWRHSTD